MLDDQKLNDSKAEKDNFWDNKTMLNYFRLILMCVSVAIEYYSSKTALSKTNWTEKE